MRRIFFGALALATVALTVVFVGSAGAAKPPPPTSSGGCPSGSLSNYPTSSIVGYSITNDATNTTSTYKFFSQAQTPTGPGVPGLQGYCVYTTPAPKSDTTTGGDVPTWKASKPGTSFGFTRPGGESTNIPLDGNTYTVGFATWDPTGSAPLPAAQTVLLHLSGSAAAVCNGLPSCFVRPTLAPVPCSKGDSTVAYNAMPSDVVNCVNPGIGFEGTSTSEFGNAVNLSSTAGRTLDSFSMDMQSFACQTGHWNGNPDDLSSTVEPCAFTDSTNPTFQWQVTANIYAVNGDGSPGALLATSGPVTQTIPYRPAHDGTGHCINSDNNASDSGNRWWNPAALGGAGACQSSIATVLSFSNFTAPGGGAPASLPGQVIWTVSFATTSEGTLVSPAQGVKDCSSGSDARFPGLTDGGCPYDSLNPGDNGNSGGTDFPASHITLAPYAGSDFTPGVAYLNQGTGLQSQTGWDGLRPLGEIITS